MRTNFIKEVHQDKLSGSEHVVLEHLSDTLLSLSQEAVRLAVQLKENSSKIEQLIGDVNDLSSNVRRPKAVPKRGFANASKDHSNVAGSHYTIPTSTYWAFE
jgi:hypothetical protein